MKLYNSLTRSVDEFRSVEEGRVRMYTCGPTVYHFAHIGNLRTYIMEDVLEKYLRWSGYQVDRVMVSFEESRNAYPHPDKVLHPIGMLREFTDR